MIELTPSSPLTITTPSGDWTLETDEAGVLTINTPRARQIDWEKVRIVGNWRGLIIKLKGMK